MNKVLFTPIFFTIVFGHASCSVVAEEKVDQPKRKSPQGKVNKALYMTYQVKLLENLQTLRELKEKVEKQLHISIKELEKAEFPDQTLREAVNVLTIHVERLKDEIDKTPADRLELASLYDRFWASFFWWWRDKLSYGLMVVDAHGNELSTWASFKRMLWKIPGSFAFLYQWLIGKEGRSWHDQKSESYVIKIEFMARRKNKPKGMPHVALEETKEPITTPIEPQSSDQKKDQK